MTRKKIITALLASPIISLYGLAPVIIFYPAKLSSWAFSFASLCVMMMLFWLVNIWLLNTSKPRALVYFTSYSITFFFHLVILLLMPGLPDLPGYSVYLIYPLISTIAINTIIIIIINAQTLKEKNTAIEVELQKVKVENLEAQKKVLQQQLQPHFLFNALSVLKSMIMVNAGKAVDYTLQLSGFLRYTTMAGTRETVSLQEELTFTKDYLDLQKARFEDALICDIVIEDSLLNCRIPVFAIQSLVENAIKHNSFSPAKPLRISISSAQDQLIISNPLQPKALVQVSGTGLSNLNNRYLLMFNQPIIIDKTGSEFSVKLPLICI